jgi:GNAT superfamily N-acetyltransferase
MTFASIQIVPCPPELSIEAFALVLHELTPSQRRGLIPPRSTSAHEALLVAINNDKLVGATWGQRQPGSTAILWPPHVVDGIEAVVAVRLICAATAALDAADIRMAQALVPNRQSRTAQQLESAGYEYLVDLMYLNWEAARAPREFTTALEFEKYDESQQQRFADLIERTYVGSQDCAAMNGRRPMAEVLHGYRATGSFRPENWLFARHQGEDVGVLLLADHGASEHWELVYMGVVPAARGQQFGAAIVHQAQQLTHRNNAARLVLAVDAANVPAIKMYNDSGFLAWDTRTVYVHFATSEIRARETA